MISIEPRTRLPSIEGQLLGPREAHDYRIQIAANTGQLRVEHINFAGETISFQILDAEEAYSLAQKILKGYDRLEGL